MTRYLVELTLDDIPGLPNPANFFPRKLEKLDCAKAALPRKLEGIVEEMAPSYRQTDIPHNMIIKVSKGKRLVTEIIISKYDVQYKTYPEGKP